MLQLVLPAFWTTSLLLERFFVFHIITECTYGDLTADKIKTALWLLLKLILNYFELEIFLEILKTIFLN